MLGPEPQGWSQDAVISVCRALRSAEQIVEMNGNVGKQSGQSGRWSIRREARPLFDKGVKRPSPIDPQPGVDPSRLSCDGFPAKASLGGNDRVKSVRDWKRPTARAL